MSVAVDSRIGNEPNNCKYFNHAFRFPYNSDFGRRECCGGQTFMNDKKCCVRNQVKECKPDKPGPYGGR